MYFSPLLLLFTSRQDDHTRRLGSLFGAEESLRKATISFVDFVRPSVRPTSWYNSTPTRRIFMQINIVYFF
jgi:hypothetical protein